MIFIVYARSPRHYYQAIADRPYPVILLVPKVVLSPTNRFHAMRISPVTPYSSRSPSRWYKEPANHDLLMSPCHKGMESADCVEKSTYIILKTPWRAAGCCTLRDMEYSSWPLCTWMKTWLATGCSSICMLILSTQNIICAFWPESSKYIGPLGRGRAVN
jgi:hypothetical protein